MDGFYKFDNQCYASCTELDVETQKYYTDSNGECKPCGVECVNCQEDTASSTGNSCFECGALFYLHEENCETSCPVGYYEVGKVCQ